MGDQSVGSSVRTPGLASTPFTPMSPLPSMDALMQSPGLVDSPGQEGKAPSETLPALVQKALPREATVEKLEQAEALIENVRRGASDMIAALRETARAASAEGSKSMNERKRHLGSTENEPSPKHVKLAGAVGKGLPDPGQVSAAEDAEVTPVSLVIDRVEAALAELAGLGKELTEAGVSFVPSSLDEAKVEPDGGFASREWSAFLAQRKAADDVEKVQSMFRNVYLQLRGRYEEDRETVWELDKVAKDTDASFPPERVAGVLRLLQENAFLEKTEEAPNESLLQQLGRLQSVVGKMELELVGESGAVLWHSGLKQSGNEVSEELEGREKGAEDRPAKLRCLLPGVLRAALGVSRDGQLMTVAIYGATQASEKPEHTAHHVFSTVTNIATSALLHFKRQRPRSALERFLVWLSSYRSLFTQSCSVCGKLLAHDPRSDLLLPPVMRSYKAILPSDAPNREATHSVCHIQMLA